MDFIKFFKLYLNNEYFFGRPLNKAFIAIKVKLIFIINTKKVLFYRKIKEIISQI